MIGPVRVAAGAAGVATSLYGGYLLADLGWANAWATLKWLIGGVVLHDGVLSLLTIVLALVAIRVLGRDRLAPWVVGLVILAPVTLLAVPELGRFGARTDNQTLLDRNYWLGWWVLVAVVVVAIVVAAYAGRRRTSPAPPSRGGDDGSRAGG